MFDKLSAPFPPEAVSWRAQQVFRNDDGSAVARALAYINARDVMRRLDDVCTPAGWSDSYHETAKGRLICTISIRIGDEWISKSDGAGDTAVEGEKGAISDAFKRAAVKWGIGRYLYEADSPLGPCKLSKAGKWAAWLDAAKPRFAAALAKAAQAKHVIADDGPPASVDAFLNGLADALRENRAADYWTEHFTSVPGEWREYVNDEKEAMKQAAAKSATVAAG